MWNQDNALVPLQKSLMLNAHAPQKHIQYYELQQIKTAPKKQKSFSDQTSKLLNM